MARIRAAGVLTVALLPGLAPTGDAAAEPQLFQGTVVVGGYPFTISNPGRIASVHGSSPASFEIAASLLGGALTFTGTVAGLPAKTFFSFANEAGSFSTGAGPGSAAFAPLPSHPGFRASFSGSPLRFGGTQRLLGRILLQWATATPLQQTIFDLPLTPIGGSFGETRTEVHGGTAGFTRTTLWGFPWTTGSVTAMGTYPTASTLITTAAQGSDQRTAAGQGTIKLVAPFLVKRSIDLAPELEARIPGVATLTLHFAPEPTANLLLVAGVVGFVLLSRLSRRG
jgi:hypothetical protein